MKTAIQSRRLILFIALAATVAAAGWVAGQEEMTPATDVRQTRAVEEPAKPAVKSPPSAAATVDVEKLQQRTVSRDFGDMFPSRSWLPPPPPPAKPEPPRAPPLPFTFFGRMVEDGKTVVFLAQKDQTFAVKAGETVAGNYRIEEISTTSVVMTYLPLKELQTLNMGEIQ